MVRGVFRIQSNIEDRAFYEKRLQLHAVNCFRKKLHLRRSTGSWIRLWCLWLLSFITSITVAIAIFMLEGYVLILLLSWLYILMITIMDIFTASVIFIFFIFNFYYCYWYSYGYYYNNFHCYLYVIFMFAGCIGKYL